MEQQKQTTALTTEPQQQAQIEPSRKVTFSINVSGMKNLLNSSNGVALSKIRYAIEFPSVSTPLLSYDRLEGTVAELKDGSVLFDNTANPISFTRDVGETLINSLLNDPVRVLIFDSSDPASELQLGSSQISLAAMATSSSNEVSGSFPFVPILPPLQHETTTEPDSPKPPLTTLEVSISTSDPLLTESERMRATWLTLNIGPLSKLPAACQTASAPTCFKFSLWFHLKPDSASDGTRLLITDGKIVQPKEEGSGPMIEWSCARKYFLSARTADSWKAGISSGTMSHLVLEIRRDLTEEFAGKIEDNASQKYKGHALVELKGILQPGQTEIVGKYPVVHCDHSEDPIWLLSPSQSKVDLDPTEATAPAPAPATTTGKTELDPKSGEGKSRHRSRSRGKTKGGEEDEDEDIAPDAGAAAGSDKKKKGGRSKAHSKGKVKAKQSKIQSELEKALKADDESKPYEKAESILSVSLVFSKPLVPLPPPPKEKLKASDFLPKRKQLPRHQQLREATQEFRIQLEQIVQDLSLEYNTIFSGTQVNETWAQGKDERRKQFFYRLNSTPAYYLMKEKLKKAIVRVVREKFTKTSSVPKDEIVALVNELYVFLVDQMHIVLNQIALSKGEKKTPEEELAEQSAKLCKTADEYEMAGHVDSASKYHQRRIALCKADPKVWYDYARFCIRSGEAAKGEECLEEVVSLSGTDNPSTQSSALLILGCRAYGTNNERALAFLEESVKLVGKQTSGTISRDALDIMIHETEDKPTKQITQEAYERVSPFLLEIKAMAFLERLLASAVLEYGSKPTFVLSLASLHLLNKRQRWAEEYAQRALDSNPQNPEPWSLLSEIYMLQKETKEDAITHLRKAVELSKKDESSLKSLIRLGKLFLESGQPDDAKEMYLRACLIKPSACLWFGVGRACYNLGELEEAERCLAEANILNVEDPDVWAMLSLTCLSLGREVEADESISHALHLGLSNSDLICEVGSAYLAQGNLSLAEKVMGSLSQITTPKANKILAESLFRQGKMREALGFYQNIAQSVQATKMEHDEAVQKIAEIKETH